MNIAPGQKLENEAGIYLIRTNSGSYIGKTTNLKIRYREHVSRLKKGTHHSKALQETYILCSTGFEFYILERCKRYRLNNREKFFIKMLKPTINKQHNDRRPVTS